MHLQDMTAVGMWTPKEKELHINILKMKAVGLQLALGALKNKIIGEDLVLISDSVTVVAFLMNRGWTIFLNTCRLAQDIRTDWRRT